METLATRFMNALKEMERGGDIEPLLALFDKGAEFVNLTRQHLQYPDTGDRPSLQATQFWRRYQQAFAHIETHFTNVIEGKEALVLEWRAIGSLANAQPIEFNGVSILEPITTEGSPGLIKKLKIYYDSAAFLPHAPRAEKTFSESVGLPEISTEASS